MHVAMGSPIVTTLAQPHALPRDGVARSLGLCAHCGQTVGNAGDTFCCVGCESVYGLLRGEHLERYYELRGPKGVPVVDHAKRRDRKWLESIIERVVASDGMVRVELDAQGMHCSACVWLLEELFRRQPGAASLLVNPSLGRLVLTVGKEFPLGEFVAKVESFGYAVGPKRKDDTSASRGLLTRFGVCVALSMNVMSFAFATYAGLASGSVFRLFEGAQMLLASAAVLVGGSVFFRAAWQAIRARALHLDLPIALGIALAYAGSVHAWLAHRPAYFDTLTVFVTLMLLGRFLQQRVLEKNRRQLLSDGGAASLLTRRLVDGVARVVPVGDLSRADVLSIASGDLVPVDGKLTSSDASCSLDWINGESRPRRYVLGDLVPAGAFNVGPAALELVAETSFEDSAIGDILRTPARSLGRRGVESKFLRRLAPLYVLGVLALATTAFAVWALATHDLGRALSVTTAMLVVTCPCAFGIATPLAYELVGAGLRKRGLYVRSADFLDKAPRVTRVVFDKTGTLTQGTLTLSNPEVLDALSTPDAEVLFAMCSASSHPKSQAIHQALARRGVRAAASVDAHEVPGNGLEATFDGHAYLLGSPSFARTSGAGDVVFTKDGAPLASLCTEELLRSDARREVSQLRRDGYEVWMLSGDDAGRVRDVAGKAGIEVERAIGDASDKAAWVRKHDRGDTLMVGDGINDLEAVAQAFCSGTPATDRPFVASRADFYFVSPGLGPVRAALVAARQLSRVVKRNFAVATAYNVVAIGLVFAGVMSPLLAAVLMPLSSVSTILATTLSLSEKGSAWKS